MDIVFASNSKSKIMEIKSLFSEHNILSLADIGFYDDIPETGESYYENAMLKINAIKEKTNLPIIADDSGIEIAFYDNKPGIYSHRWLGEDVSWKDKSKIVLNEMKDAPTTKRGCKYISCLVYLDSSHTKTTVGVGELNGEIAKEYKGDNGFGFDNIFYLPEFCKVVAELSPEEKNKISSRAQAAEILKKQIA